MKVTKEQFIGVTYDELLAENARLREQVDAAHMSRLLTENENEKLLELVRDMQHAIACLVVLGDDYAGEHEDELCALDDRMRELGVDA